MFGYTYTKIGEQHIIKSQYGRFVANSRQAAEDLADKAAHRAIIERRREQQRQTLLRMDRRTRQL